MIRSSCDLVFVLFAQILSEDLGQLVAILDPGDYFGEVRFLSGGPCHYSALAATHCQLVTIDRADVDKILEDYPLLQRFSTDSSVIAG